MSISRDDCRIERMPSEHDGSFIWSIKRASHESSLLLCLISSDIFGIRTHYFNKRTMPCVRAYCEPCNRHQTSRWTGYLQAVDAKNGSRVLFEFTPAAAATFDQAHKDRGTLRGLNVIAGRTSNKINAKVQVTIKGMSDKAHVLPCEVETWPILAHIWGLKPEAPAIISGHTPDALAESERLKDVLAGQKETDENQWMWDRARLLESQLVMPLADDARRLNGKAHD